MKIESRVRKLSHRKQKRRKPRGGDSFDTNSSDEEVASSSKNKKQNCVRSTKNPKKATKVLTGEEDTKSPKNHKILKPKSKNEKNFDLLTQEWRDGEYRLEIMELELKCLDLEKKLGDFKTEIGYTEDIPSSAGSSSSGDEEEDIPLETLIDHSVSNELPDQSKISNKFESDDFNLAVMNPGGMMGKAGSIINTMHKFDIRAIIVSESHAAGKTVPKLDDTMKAFFQNRNEKKNKGGICIFLEKSIADHAVVIGKNPGPHEWLAVKVNLYSPPLVIIGMYGCQVSQHPAETIKSQWQSLWNFINLYKEDHTILLGGDLNSAVGNSLNMSFNCPSRNLNGKQLIKGVRSNNLHVLNSLYVGDQRTHVDRSSKSSRCLDYLITNNPALCTRLVVDNDKLATPYQVIAASSQAQDVNKIDNRKFTDHKSIVASFKLSKAQGSKCEPPPPIIVKNKEGHAKFFLFTDELVEPTIDLLNSGVPIITVYSRVIKQIKKGENKSYLRITKTKIKRKMWSDNEIFMSLVNHLEKEAKAVENLKVNDKIFKTRSKKMTSEMGEELFSMFDERGKLIEDKKGILDVLTDYNEKLLNRVPHSDKFKDIFEAKKQIVENLAETKLEDYNTITPREYTRAIQKLMIKGKNMFKQFLAMSPRMIAVFYFIFKRLYEEEVIPEDMKETTLIALHKKNDKRLASNYRFLHLKSDVARIFELLCYQKLENHFDTFTDESQMGGRKDCDTIENLAMLTSLIKAREEEKAEGIISTFIDAQKCFDRSFLTDNHAILQIQGADKKACKNLYNFQKEAKVKMAGSEREIVIKGGEGQGGIPAARRTTGGMTEATVRNSNRQPEELKLVHRGQSSEQQGYVDDENQNADNTESAKVGCALYDDTLGELSMSAHPDKSVQVVMGNQKWIEKTIEEMEKNPSFIQGFKLKRSQLEKYLGMWFCQGQYQSIIDHNVKAKHGLMMAAAISIRSLCELPQIKRFGKIQAQKLMAISQLFPIALYSTAAWIDITEKQYGNLEKSMKKALETIFALPSSVNYEALLREAGLIHFEQFLDMIKLKIWCHKLHVKKWGKMYRVLMHEIAYDIQGGMADDLRKLSAKYNLRDITIMEVTPDQITEACRKFSYLKQWNKHLELKSLQAIPETKKYKPWHHELPFNLARGYSMLNLGLLVLKTTQPHRFRERDMASPKDRSCLWPMCSGRDEWSHLVNNECDFYSSKFVSTGDEIMDVCVFIQKINLERTKIFKTPLVIFGGGEFANDIVANSVTDLADPDIRNNLSDKMITDQVLKSDLNRGLIPDPSVVKITKLISSEVPRLDVLCARAIKTNMRDSFKTAGREKKSDMSKMSKIQFGDFSMSSPRGHCLSVSRLIRPDHKVRNKNFNTSKSNFDSCPISSLIAAFGENRARLRSMNNFQWTGPRTGTALSDTAVITTDTVIGGSNGSVSHASVAISSRVEAVKVDRIIQQSASVDPIGAATTLILEIVRDVKLIDTANIIIHHQGIHAQAPAAAGPGQGPGPGPGGEGGSGAGPGRESGAGSSSGSNIKLPSKNLLTPSKRRMDAEHPTFSSKKMKPQKESTTSEARGPIQLAERESITVYTPESVEEIFKVLNE